MHEYFYQNYPDISTNGIKTNAFDSELVGSYVECTYYDCKKVLLTEYHMGHMENNYDQSESGICQECGYIVSYDCCNDYSISVHGHNVFCFNVFSSYFCSIILSEKTYSSNKNLIKHDTIHKMLKNKNIYEILKPDYEMGKKGLGKYIHRCIKKNKFEKYKISL